MEIQCTFHLLPHFKCFTDCTNPVDPLNEELGKIEKNNLSFNQKHSKKFTFNPFLVVLEDDVIFQAG